MTVIINGDTGISGVNGSAANPAITGTDADTGIHFGADTAAITTGGTDKVSIDSTGDTTFSGTVKTSKVENANTSNGGVEIDTAGHVQVDGIQLPTTGTLTNRNILVNGSMQVAQRSTAAESNAVAFNANTAYDTVDRWGFWASNPDRFTSQQVVDAPPGHYNSLQITSSLAHTFTAGHGFTVTQRIEAQNLYGTGIGTAAAKSYTFTFWVKSSLTGTFSFYALNGLFTKSFVSDYTINVADTWEYKTISIPAPTDALFASIGNARQMEVGFSLGAGSQFQTANLDAWVTENFRIDSTTSSKFLETNGATIQFTGVQLEVGDRATPFEYETFSQLLAKCQRYYWQIQNAAGTGDSFGWIGTSYGADAAYVPIHFVTSMRARPSVAMGGSWRTRASNINNVTGDWTTHGIGSPESMIVAKSGAGTIPANTVYWLEAANLAGEERAFLQFSAEL